MDPLQPQPQTKPTGAPAGVPNVSPAAASPAASAASRYSDEHPPVGFKPAATENESVKPLAPTPAPHSTTFSRFSAYAEPVAKPMSAPMPKPAPTPVPPAAPSLAPTVEPTFSAAPTQPSPVTQPTPAPAAPATTPEEQPVRKILSNLRPVPVYEGMPTEKEAAEKTEHRLYAKGGGKGPQEIRLRGYAFIEPKAAPRARDTNFRLPQQGKNSGDLEAPRDQYREEPAIAPGNTLPLDVALKDAVKQSVAERQKFERVAQPKDPPELPRFRTYAGDVEDSVKANKISILKVAMAEQKKKTGKEGLANKPEKHISSMVFFSSLFLILGAGILIGVYFFVFHKSVPQQIQEIAFQTIAVEGQKEITVLSLEDTANASSKLKTEESAAITPGTIERIYFSQTSSSGKTPLSAADLFTLLKIHSPDSLVRGLNKNYIMGIYGNQNSSDPFLILSPASFESVYPAMLAWEPTLAQDVSKLFPTFDPLHLANNQAASAAAATSTATSTTAIATSTSKTKTASKTSAKQPAPKPVVQQPVVPPTPQIRQAFEDIVILNNNVRVLRDTSGNTVLLYAFPDKNHLIITTSEAALREIFTRLTTAANVVR